MKEKARMEMEHQGHILIQTNQEVIVTSLAKKKMSSSIDEVTSPPKENKTYCEMILCDSTEEKTKVENVGHHDLHVKEDLVVRSEKCPKKEKIKINDLAEEDEFIKLKYNLFFNNVCKF